MDSYGRWPIHIDGLPKRTIFHSKLSQITGVYWVYLKIWNPQIHPQVRHDSLADIFLSKISFSIFSPLANGWVKDLLSPSSCLGREVLRQTTKQASEAPQARRARYPPWSGRGDPEVSWNGGTPIAGWFIMGKCQSKMDDLGVPLFQETPILYVTWGFSHVLFTIIMIPLINLGNYYQLTISYYSVDSGSYSLFAPYISIDNRI